MAWLLRFGLLVTVSLALALGGCSSSSDDDDDSDGGGSANDIPDYEIVSEDTEGCAVIGEDGSITSEDSCGFYIVFTDAVSKPARVTIEGTILGSEISPMFFAGDDTFQTGWKVDVGHGGEEDGTLNFGLCTTVDCDTFVAGESSESTYSTGDTFAFAVEMHAEDGVDVAHVWVDSTPDDNEEGDFEIVGDTMYEGDVMGIQVRDVTISNVVIEQE